MKKILIALLIVVCFTAIALGQDNKITKKVAEDVVQGEPAGPINDNSYVIGPEDVITVFVWKESELTQTVAVRPDGKISLPLINDLMASGFTTMQLKVEITQLLQKYIADPSVTVIVQSARSRKATVMGEIARPGSYFINGPMTLVQLISLAGGFRDFAATDKITVVRQQNSRSIKLKFNYKDFVKGKHLEENIEIQPGDIIVVP